MICYLLVKSPLWEESKISTGQRNVRILFVALLFYFLLHVFARECKETSLSCQIIYDYFWWIIAADILLCGCEYRIYYGRSILNELNRIETDKFDNATHKYLDKIESTKESVEEPTKIISTELIKEPVKKTKVYFTGNER
jgi:hypothetical protein